MTDLPRVTWTVEATLERRSRDDYPMCGKCDSDPYLFGEVRVYLTCDERGTVFVEKVTHLECPTETT